MNTFHVVPGYRCNKFCGHCANDSGPGRRGGLSALELTAIKAHVSSTAPEQMMFTGGEPTLYIDSINEIIGSHPTPETCKVHITTNGWFTKLPEAKFNAVIGRIDHLKSIQLSFDTFHGNDSDISGVERLMAYCSQNSIAFNVSVAVSSVAQTAAALDSLRGTGCEIIISKVEASGRAKANKLSFDFPVFDESVLDKGCPNIDQLSFHPQKGFSVCCANLVYNSDPGGIAHASPEDHYASKFYQGLKAKTFRQRLAEVGLKVGDLKPEHSLACNLCELIEDRRRDLEAV